MEILLIDDEEDVRASLSNFIRKLGHDIVCADDGAKGWQHFCRHDPDLIITDIRMPGLDGLELLRRIKKVRQSAALVIVITGHGDMENAIKALKYGAYDYLQKPIDVRELAITLERAMDFAALRKKYHQLKTNFQQELAQGTEILRHEAEHYREAYFQEVGLGDMRIFSDGMRTAAEQAEKYSTDRSIPVLIQGESGTGKELIAKLIHFYALPQSGVPFVAINCGAIAHELFEGELFGHEPGAFTGASAKGRIGKIEAARGGTLFLDEIAEMPLGMQVKLLRVLEERKLYRVGGVKEIPVDIRVVSATNKNLRREVAAGHFRLDLLHRIKMGFIAVPPLRERTNAIVPLAHHFISKAYARRGMRFEGFSPKAETLLQTYSWPGNVRQLKNNMERLAIMKPNLVIQARDIESILEDIARDYPETAAGMLNDATFELPEQGFDLDQFNSTIILKALEKNHHNKTHTAHYLGISRRILQGRLKKMGL